MGSVNGDVELAQWDTRSNHSHGGSSSQGSSGPGDEKIYVSVRMRPLNEKEIANYDFSDWECLNNTTVVFKNSLGERPMYPNAYHFDRVFGGDSSTRQVYEQAAKDIALSVVNGINSSIFAYGQTSSGKTYTMGGITRYTIDDIFDHMDEHQEREYRVKFSAMEIYNEAVRDLLSPDATPLRLLDDPERGTVVERLTEENVMDKSHLLELISWCEVQRQTGETALNETSSRSHQILRLSVESTVRQLVGASDTSTLAANVSFVDLAGSERASQTLSAGTRLKEGAHINRSLLTLGTVIRKLSKGRNGHVPYRDSKLTRILQNSLGGNAKTAIICTMSPAHAHLEQSRNTLLFGSCAKQVNTNAHVNVLISDKELVKQLRKELARLEGELKYMSSNSNKGDSSQLLKEKEQRIEKMEKELEELRHQRDEAQLRVDQILQSAGLSQAARQEVISNHLNGHGRKSSLLEEYSSVLSDMSDYQRLVTDLKALEPITPLSSLRNEIELNNDEFLTAESPQFPSQPPELFGPQLPSSQQGFNSYITIQKPTIQQHSEDNCNVVRCVEVDEDATKVVEKSSGTESNHDDKIIENNKKSWSRQGSFTNTKEDTIHSPEEYDTLVNRIKELQKTIDCLVNRNQEVGNSPCSTESSIPSSYRGGACMNRSRSCKAVLTNYESSTFDRSLHNLDLTLNGFEAPLPGSRRLRLFTRHSHSSDFSGSDDRTSSTWNSNDNADKVVSIRNQDVESNNTTCDASECSTSLISNFKSDSEHQSNYDKDVLSLPNIEVMGNKRNELNESTRDDTLDSEPGDEQSPSLDNQDQECDGNDDMVLANKSESITDDKDTARGSPVEPPSDWMHDIEHKRKTLGLNVTKESGTETSSSWLQEFEQKQRKIIELWDACYTSIVHRSYFFLLFETVDPSDSVYIEVEIRRLSFIQSQFSRNMKIKMEGQILTPAASLKALNHERETLARQMQKRLTSKEREALFKKWGIKLDSKRRRLQLSRRLWTDTKDMNHVRESASLVAKVAGLFDEGQVPKEMFVGHSFSPKSKSISRRSHSWKDSFTFSHVS